MEWWSNFRTGHWINCHTDLCFFIQVVCQINTVLNQKTEKSINSYHQKKKSVFFLLQTFRDHTDLRSTQIELVQKTYPPHILKYILQDLIFDWQVAQPLKWRRQVLSEILQNWAKPPSLRVFSQIWTRYCSGHPWQPWKKKTFFRTRLSVQ